MVWYLYGSGVWLYECGTIQEESFFIKIKYAFYDGS